MSDTEPGTYYVDMHIFSFTTTHHIDIDMDGKLRLTGER
jgi:hypothetical protein